MISANMGRYYFDSKQESDSLYKIKIWWLKENDFLNKDCWRSGGIKWTNQWTSEDTVVNIIVDLLTSSLSHSLELSYDYSNRNGVKESVNYKVPLTTTPCFFGGIRYWFICQLIVDGKYCGRRVAILYKYGKYFGCRNCFNLTYESRNENRRFKDYSLFRSLMGLKKIDELESKIKRKFYAGKPTRKQQALDKYFQRLVPFLRNYK